MASKRETIVALERYLFHRNYLFALAFIVLGILWWCRGSYVTGWETLGPAKAKLEIGEQGYLTDLLAFWRASREFFYWNPTNSVIFGYLPGLLTYLRPGLFWGCRLTVLCVSNCGFHSSLVLCECERAGS